VACIIATNVVLHNQKRFERGVSSRTRQPELARLESEICRMRGFRPPNHTAEPQTRVGEATTYRPQPIFRANRIHHSILAKDTW
jgi:hypothetical protein